MNIMLAPWWELHNSMVLFNSELNKIWLAQEWKVCKYLAQKSTGVDEVAWWPVLDFWGLCKCGKRELTP